MSARDIVESEEPEKHRSADGVLFWAQHNSAARGVGPESWLVVAQAEGGEPTEAWDDWFASAKDADEIARMLAAGEDPNATSESHAAADTPPLAEETDGYRVDNGRIVSPGAYEGEPLWVPYFVENVVLDRSSEYVVYVNGMDHDFVIFHDEDKTKFPELKNLYGAMLWQDDSGFWHKSIFPTKEGYGTAIARMEDFADKEAESPE